MQRAWTLDPQWELLDAGTAAEKAAFGSIEIQAYGACLSEGLDSIARRIRRAPYLSAYHLAEWLAWNWWRQRWEPLRQDIDWGLTHRMTSIGQGYLWPDLTLFSDGAFVTLQSKATRSDIETPYRYLCDSVSVIPAADFEREVETFISLVLERLDAMQVRDSNLKIIWQALCEERADPELAHLRKLEAIAGIDPGEIAGAELSIWQMQEQAMGISAFEEILALRHENGNIVSMQDMQAVSQENGYPCTAGTDSLASQLNPGNLMTPWQIGVSSASALRSREKLGTSPVSDTRLAELFGITPKALTQPKHASKELGFSFVIAAERQSHRVVLRSKWRTGCRFELARLLGDRLISATADPVLPATRAYTYRQKIQRAFSAELLSPLNEVLGVLNEDYSEEARQEAADYFGVSEWTIRTQLVNSGHIPRDDIECVTATSHRKTEREYA